MAASLHAQTAAPLITSPSLATGGIGQSFSYALTGTNSPAGFTVAGTTPAGLSFNSGTAVISGTPTTTGTFSLSLAAINASGTTTQPLTIVIFQPATLATGRIGLGFYYAITGTNNPTSFSATGVPAGLSLSAGNAGGTGTATLTLTVSLGAPIIGSATAASAIVGIGFSYTITASNIPTSFSATGLPSGLTLNAATGVISGTAMATGTSTVTLGAGNAAGTRTATLTLTVNPPPPVIISAATATGISGAAFSYAITASNSPTNFGAAGLPSGLSVNGTTGLISGATTAIGTSLVILRANNITATGTAPLMLTINMPAPAITSTLTATATNGEGFSYQITASNIPTSYSAMGLPMGLTVNGTTGWISGTTTATGTNDVTISAINLGGTGSAVLALVVGPPYLAWQSQMFTPAQLANASISGDSASPAGDAIPNLLKYALGLNPWTDGVSGLPVATLVTTGGGIYPTLTYTQALSATDITYTVQVSTDLATWNSGPGYTVTTGTTYSQDGETESVTVQSATPVSGSNAALFMRLQVTGP